MLMDDDGGVVGVITTAFKALWTLVIREDLLIDKMHFLSVWLIGQKLVGIGIERCRLSWL